MNRHGQIQRRFLYWIMLMLRMYDVCWKGCADGPGAELTAKTRHHRRCHIRTFTVRHSARVLQGHARERFREAFAMSIYKPAIEGLKTEEFDDLRPDFERLAAALPDRVEINGEQISADAATVFVKVKVEEKPEAAEPVALIRVDGNWIVGDKESQAIVQKAGKTFFFNARIDTHHGEVQAMLQRISVAQLVYSQQHNGKFGDMAALVLAALIPKDIEGTESTGYKFRIVVSPDGKSWSISGACEVRAVWSSLILYG